ncbi:MAG: SIS domain-containing protein [Mangrovibacterium sp.]|jgi:D-sedoheptulose 7-phosphate isomerase
METILKELTERHPLLVPLKDTILKAAESLIGCYRNSGKVLVCGNGGSCSDSDHIVGELMKGFEKKRLPGEDMRSRLLSVDSERGVYLAEKLQQALPAISLTAHHALITAVANDNGADLIFAQQVMGYGNEGDVLIALTTSGNSRNVVDAAITAKAKRMTVIGLTGGPGGKLASLCDILINVPGKSTAQVQELHLPVYHTLCQMVESHFF